MTTLTSEQREAGRRFRASWRAQLQHLNELDPRTTDSCSAHITWYRHDCRGHGSQALFLRQQYALSPDGLFVFYYRAGKCAKCGFSVRTEGDFDLAENCPAEKGAALHDAPHQLPDIRPDQGNAPAAP